MNCLADYLDLFIVFNVLVPIVHDCLENHAWLAPPTTIHVPLIKLGRTLT